MQRLRMLLDGRFGPLLLIAIWYLPLLLVVACVGEGVVFHTNVWPVYAAAAQRWLARAPLYETRTIDHFQYFPLAAIVAAPFASVGVALGGALWRAAGWVLYAGGLWRLARLTAPDDARPTFFLASAIALAPSGICLANGQANLALAAAFLHASCELGRARPSRATAWLMLALSLKPLALVFVLLACVQYPAMRRRTLVASLLLVLLPFAVAPSGYVVEQYWMCVEKLVISAQPDRHFEDLRGLVWRLGWEMPRALLLVLQLAAALGAAAVCARLQRRREPEAALLLFAVAGVYLVLFNPRTQANSYVIVAPAVALPAALFWLRGRWRAVLMLMAIAATWTGAPRFAWSWLRPLSCLVFGALLLREIFREPARAHATGDGLSPARPAEGAP